MGGENLHFLEGFQGGRLDDIEDGNDLFRVKKKRGYKKKVAEQASKQSKQSNRKQRIVG